MSAAPRAYLFAALVLGAALAGLRVILELDVPLGSDSGMWGLSAAEILRGEFPSVQPLFPLLVAVAATLTGQATWWAGGLLSVALAAMVPPLVVALARNLGVSWPLALAAGVAALVLPEQFVFAFQLQPDALSEVLLLLVLAAGLHWERGGQAWPWLLAGLALAATREHGLVVLAAMPFALAARRWPRATLGALPLGALAVAALLLFFPFELLPERLSMAMSGMPLAAGRFPPPHYLVEITGADNFPVRQAWDQGAVFTFWGEVIAQMLRRHWPNLLVVAAGGAGFVFAGVRGRGGWSALVTLAPVVALVLSWSHRRHSALLLPVALVGIALGLQLLSRRKLGLALALGVLAAPLSDAGWLLDRLQGQAQAAREVQKIGAWLSERPAPHLLGGLDNEVNLYLGWERNNPRLPGPCEPEHAWTGADWNTWWVGPAGVAPPFFEQVHEAGRLGVFRLRWKGEGPRPCRQVEPVAGPLFLNKDLPGRALPSCSQSAPWPLELRCSQR